MHPLRAIVLGWLGLFVLDGLVTLGGLPIQLLTTLAVLLTAPLMVLAAVITPRVPARLILPPVLFAGWALLGAMPILLWTLGGPWMQPLVAGVQLAVLVVVALAAWRLGPFEERPAFSWRRSAGLGLGLVVGGPLLLIGYVWGSMSHAVRYGTDGFAGLDLQGAWLTERTYVRGENTVHLVGMMHIGEQRAYDELYDAFGALPDAVVLAEGVSDEQGLLTSTAGYQRVAVRADLVEQPPIAREGLTVRRADIDVADLSPEVVELLNAAFGVWGADNPALAYVALVGDLDTADPDALLRTLWDELVEQRNQRVLDEIDRVEPEFEHIVVPWGALHLPGIAASLERAGYQQTGETHRRLFRYATLL